MATNLRKVADIRQGDKESLESFAMRFMVQVENAEKVSGKWIPSNLKGRSWRNKKKGGTSYWLVYSWVVVTETGTRALWMSCTMILEKETTSTLETSQE